MYTNLHQLGFLLLIATSATGFTVPKTPTTTSLLVSSSTLWAEPTSAGSDAKDDHHEPGSPHSAMNSENNDKNEEEDNDEEEGIVKDLKEDININTDTDTSFKTDLTPLLQIAATTGRGEFATTQQKESAMQFIQALEAVNPTPVNPTKSPLMEGTWELVYSNTQLFRSSPFFMAGRAVCSTEDEAARYDWFCDMHRGALAISTIGAVRQIVSSTRLVSEFEVKAGAVPFLSDFTPFAYSGGWPVTVEGAIVSSADITPLDDAWEVFMDTVEIKGSNLPGVRQALDAGLKLQSRQLSKVLEEQSAIPYSNPPKPIVRTTYLSESFRILRDADGKVFCYTKTSDRTTPTDYSNVMSDLGVSKLLEGFNDAILKFYI